ncbi:hypothetical protein ACIBHX_02065 [Nonomuraea sp. NPDC050536]|uniref:hypothetical protein n=1 Tax=Nonomuraea sp. NPDC050536 TaxID=3364366 RepID=UPI0037C61029
MLKVQLATLGCAGALAAGCSGSGAPQSAQTATVTVTAEPTVATEKQPALIKIGSQHPFNDSDSTGTMTVLKFRQPFPSRFPPDRAGYEFAGIEIRQCFKTISAKEGISVGWEPWSLTYKNGTIVDPPSSWSADHFSVPLYPRDRPVRAGQCVRGWIPYEVPKGKKPSTVAYTLPASDTQAAMQVEWTVR